jgi:hypothetical protein
MPPETERLRTPFNDSTVRPRMKAAAQPAYSMKKMFFGSIGVIMPRRNFSPVIGT